MNAPDRPEPLPFRAVYITGRDGPHPMHKALVARTPLDLGRRDAVLQAVTEESPRWQQYLSWVVNGWSCGLGIREDDTLVTRNTSRFVPHRMSD